MSRNQTGKHAEEIAADVERQMAEGAYPPGASLPPIRTLAQTLGVSPVTVAAAYRRLQQRGLVTAGGRRGTRVRPQIDAAVPLPPAGRSADNLIDLASGNPDPALLPPLETVLRNLPTRPWLYGDEPVLPSLAAFAADDFAADGITPGPIGVFNGALDAIERLLRESVRPGDRVGIEDPGAPAVIDLIRTSGYIPEPVPIDDDGVDPAALTAALAHGARAIVITPRAQNPTGAALSPQRLDDLRSVLRRHEALLVIENDPAGPIAGVSMRTLADDGRQRWAVVRSVSKFLGPDLRVAIATGDPLLMKRVLGRQALGVRWVSHLLQQIALSVWSNPSSGRHLAHAADLYRQRRSALVDALTARGIPAMARSGFNVWIAVRHEAAATQMLARRGWAVAAGEPFRLRSGPAIRVTTSALAASSADRFAADCAEALRRSASAPA
jgi:DNA-binding transcriptional MocR family regulator